jgi:hypothetical protein
VADPLEKLLASISAALESAQADLALDHAAPAAARPDVLAGCFSEELAFIKDPSTLQVRLLHTARREELQRRARDVRRRARPPAR